MIDLSALLQGFVLGLGMFVCPGPKDVLILREALSGRSPVQLVGIGTGSDLVLIALGILGLSAALHAAPGLQLAAQLLGIALLLLHGAQAARSALVVSPTVLAVVAPAGVSSSRGLRQLLLVSLLNPAAWLDTVLVIGTVGAALPAGLRLGYAAGAVGASLVWFTAWVTGARHARRWMGNPRNWRLLDLGVALAMLGMAAWMALGLA
ncbi:LysE/ArgO family amino acid transporter [Pseudorhodoferax sp. Leaf274]|uniref:LysE/ArgO family amino acid transporter n=1 Tax=Pseudorhodoferax sp. Leaf274 TaxID=1736318 RepID=UPI000703AE06|nr:LysE family transporter [Pseudorhodoferax sp. Leaf274]KQP49071.1 lysine transporter LysE [Pseudorhodoferax sp. Leaf274]